MFSAKEIQSMLTEATKDTEAKKRFQKQSFNALKQLSERKERLIQDAFFLMFKESLTEDKYKDCQLLLQDFHPRNEIYLYKNKKFFQWQSAPEYSKKGFSFGYPYSITALEPQAQ